MLPVVSQPKDWLPDHEPEVKSTSFSALFSL